MILITGINGEMGSALVKKLHEMKIDNIIGFDLNPPKENIKSYLHKNYIGDIQNESLIKQIFKENNINTIYHLAAILSTKAESNPIMAHNINVGGFLNIIKNINEPNVKFFFPSSIAVYLLENKNNNPITEEEFCNPNNIYGCNKLYCEKLGSYFSQYANTIDSLDFRSIRFSGIISADTLPHGGTSDYAPEMIHHAIQNKGYTCFVRPDSCIPFMVMPDAINAIIKLMGANKKTLTKDVYHIQAFSPTVEDIWKKLIVMFPNFKLDYNVNPNRQALIDSWPSVLDQSRALKDWGWNPKYNFDNAFDKYLIPKITEFYKK
jgi:nucleoside-diphosphate-sugar epimerase